MAFERRRFRNRRRCYLVYVEFVPLPTGDDVMADEYVPPLKIEKLFAFVHVEEDGSEGILAFQRDGLWLPMIGADQTRVEALIEVADEMDIEYEIRYYEQVPAASLLN